MNTFFKIITYTFVLMVLLTNCIDQKRQNSQTKKQNDKKVLPIMDVVGGEDYSFPESHASTLIRLENGIFVVAWFGGTKEGNDDVGIYMSKGKPGKWSPPKKIVKIREEAHWNPVLFKTREGDIHLFFKVGKTIAQWETWQTISGDGGNTWSEPKELVTGDKGGRGPVRNKPILLSNGDLLAGASNEDGKWNVFVDYSKDMGETWKRTQYLALDRDGFKGKGVIQPTLWESVTGKVHMLVRSTNDYVYRSDSEDFGKTWSLLYKTTLHNPNSALDITKVNEKTLALVYNPTTKKTGNRSRLHVAFSYDNGENWMDEIVIEEEDDGGKSEGFAYPAIISFGDTIAITYTWKRKKIKFWMGVKNINE